jgi:SAM-dependent methyltransferase
MRTAHQNLRFLLSQDLYERWNAQTQRNDVYEQAVDARIEERFAALLAQMDARIHAMEARLSTYERAVDERFEKRAEALQHNVDLKFDERAEALDKRFDANFSERVRVLDQRLDDRLSHLEMMIGQRFQNLETRTDDRLEAHERLVDSRLHNNRQDIVDRTDLLLQVFEQRMDRMRRELKSIRDSLANSASPAESRSTPVQPSASSVAESNHSNGHPVDKAETLSLEDSSAQLISFRKLAADSGLAPRTKFPEGEIALYHRILDWKKIAHEGMNDFTEDEQETADYILSFVSDPKERDYVRQHLRRFVATLQRIPPALKSSDRLLELGSLSHIAPAILKFSGYKEVLCADYWEGDEKISHETVRQVSGSDSYQFELRNFNVESDPFPYPDAHFRVVLCCELIEHLQRDPMHMLWECNRVLEKDGFLLLTTPNIASARAIEGLLVGCAPYLLSQYNIKTPVDQHNREYAPYEIGLALAAAGFTVVELEAEDVWMRSNPAILDLLKDLRLSTEMRGDNIFALARKTSAPVERFPKELYIE